MFKIRFFSIPLFFAKQFVVGTHGEQEWRSRHNGGGGGMTAMLDRDYNALAYIYLFDFFVFVF